MRQVIRSGSGPLADDAAPQRRATTVQRVMPFAVALVPLALALALVPGRTVTASMCPPSGEGLVACQIFEGWAPYVTSVCLVWLALYVAGQLVFLVLPQVVARLRAGERLRREAPLPRIAVHQDPALAAATWGQSTAATPTTKVLGGFAWAHAANRAQRVTATPQLLQALPASSARPVQAVPTAQDDAPAFRPVALPGGLSLNVCPECLTIVESAAGGPPADCPNCGAAAHRESRIGVAVAPRRPVPSPPATRVALLSTRLDERGVLRLQEAIARRPGEPRRVVVLQLPAGERTTPTSLRALEDCAHAAREAGGAIVVVAVDEAQRAGLAAAGLVVAPSTARAMELAAELAPSRPAPGAVRGTGHPIAL